MSRSSRTTPDGRGPTALTGGLPGDEERAFPLTPEEGEGEEEEEHDLLHDQHDEHQSGLPMHWGYAGWAFLLAILISVPWAMFVPGTDVQGNGAVGTQTTTQMRGLVCAKGAQLTRAQNLICTRVSRASTRAYLEEQAKPVRDEIRRTRAQLKTRHVQVEDLAGRYAAALDSARRFDTTKELAERVLDQLEALSPFSDIYSAEDSFSSYLDSSLARLSPVPTTKELHDFAQALKDRTPPLSNQAVAEADRAMVLRSEAALEDMQYSMVHDWVVLELDRRVEVAGRRGVLSLADAKERLEAAALWETKYDCSGGRPDHVAGVDYTPGYTSPSFDSRIDPAVVVQGGLGQCWPFAGTPYCALRLRDC